MGQNTRSSHTSLDFYIGGVPVEHLNAMPTKVTDALKKIIKDGIDMTRMSAILKRDRLKVITVI
jgi:Zn-dependent M16 (insulinase) family peptidase